MGGAAASTAVAGSDDDRSGDGAASPAGRDRGDLVAGHRAAEVGHRPARGEHLRRVLARTPEHELPLAEARDRRVDGGDVGPARRARHAVEQPRLVAVGLQPADHPGAGVRDRLVVDVHRVLRRQDHAEAERPRLLHQGHDRLLGGRVRRGRQAPARDLVHVEHRSQAGGTALLAHPGDELREHEGHHELAFLVGEVGDGQDGTTGAAVGPEQHRCDVERFTLGPPRGE